MMYNMSYFCYLQKKTPNNKTKPNEIEKKSKTFVVRLCGQNNIQKIKENKKQRIIYQYVLCIQI